jgi:hypothetical protein
MSGGFVTAGLLRHDPLPPEGCECVVANQTGVLIGLTGVVALCTLALAYSRFSRRPHPDSGAARMAPASRVATLKP